MRKPQDQHSVEVLFVEYYKTEDEAKAYIDEMIDDGYACNLFNTPLGYFVSVLEVELSE